MPVKTSRPENSRKWLILRGKSPKNSWHIYFSDSLHWKQEDFLS
jgi:hypothetical protein